ncbi:gp72 [Shigella virus Moo19]|uniref:Uncharacterized protein n=1 Tax=Shigella virus Moo19 TaxID=2886042 RepID=A0AAE8YCS1_9CAUD|nr:gp72 [Shigella virus Moo19]UEN68868.1 hypothetical protein Moo19_gp72 [Shigella virus Moo19]
MSINDKPTPEQEEVIQSNDTVDDVPMPDELTVLKQRAKLMNISFSNNISLEKLRQKIADAQEGKASEPEQEEPEVNPLEDTKKAPVKETEAQMRQRIRLEQTRLIRVRIQNLDPKKKDLPGEIITVANEYMGTIRKFVPFGEATDNGYHIPYCIYEFLKNRKFLNIRVSNKGKKIEQAWVREFAIEELPPLTQEDLDKLAAAQTAAGSTNND